MHLPTRRSFLRTAGAACAGLAAGGGSASAQAPLLPSYAADVNGDGRIDAADLAIVQTARFAQRGFRLAPRPGFDPRADALGRGVVDAETVAALSSSIERYARATDRLAPRPITVAWHYGWHRKVRRPTGLQTARFKGGDYLSNDPEVETTFHDLKNEFGITVDALSWIPERDPVNGGSQDAYRQGYLAAPNAGSRHVCLIYENTIALPVGPGERIDVRSAEVLSLLRKDFAAMARFLAEVRDRTPARIFRLDERPVIFIFASHTWGVLPVKDDAFDFVAELRDVFADVYGAPPFLVGDELALTPTGQFTHDRVLRTRLFDGIHRYHHAALKPDAASMRMSQAYIDLQMGVLRRTMRAISRLRNRFTDRPPLLIPSLAAGFAKTGHPTLAIDRGTYVDFMKQVRRLYLTEHLGPLWQPHLGTTILPAPVYVVGSWNEEYEGHTTFPFAFNLSVPEPVQHGFDMAMAIKEMFSWNHYAERDITGRAPGHDTPPTGDVCLPRCPG